MSDTDPYKAPDTSVDPSSKVAKHVENPELAGLGGWLILVGFGVVVSPLRMILQIYPPYTEMFSNGYWEIITTPGSQSYNPAFASILIGEMILNGILFFSWIYIAFLFFLKKRDFPKWYIGIMAFTLIFIIGDALLLMAFFPSISIADPETIKEIVQAIIGAAIWIPYMLVSKRVKATFVR